jgi:hypothetical protein
VLEDTPERAVHVKRSHLCTSLAGNACELLTITEAGASVEAMKQRRGVVITGTTKQHTTLVGSMSETKGSENS